MQFHWGSAADTKVYSQQCALRGHANHRVQRSIIVLTG
jgi:hypothetical protein